MGGPLGVALAARVLGKLLISIPLSGPLPVPGGVLGAGTSLAASLDCGGCGGGGGGGGGAGT